MLGKVMPGLFVGLLLCCLVGSTVMLRAEEAAKPESGTLTGILVAKGPNWIDVKADGEKEAVRYLPYWRGGMPKDGGGYDKATLATIKTLIVPNRVKLVWEMQEHPRIVSVEMLLPAEKAGTITGVVTAVGKEWIEVKADGEGGVPERYYPRWTGGMPKDGGGLDKTMLQAIAERKVGDHVQITWTYDERKRVTAIALLEAAK